MVSLRAAGFAASLWIVVAALPDRVVGSDTMGARTQVMTIRMRPRESLATALARGGVDTQEARRAAAALADDFDTVNAHPGLALSMRVFSGTTPGPRLVSLELAPRDYERLELFQDAGGRFHLRRVETPVFDAPILTRGTIHGSLYLSIVEAGASPDLAAQVAGLFGRSLDLTRDVESGDRFRLVWQQRRLGDGQAIGAADLVYAELSTRGGVTRLYRYQPDGTRAPEWLDGTGDAHRSALLRTPVDGARVTSGFGPRLHPLLGFTRMHQGLDFGAPTGAPVLAAADGVVEEARWSGGYGRWLKIRHGPAVETGYGHLSAWAPGMVPGAAVRQGQVVAYVGATGLATGPHLHYEVFEAGLRIDPRQAPSMGGAGPDPVGDPAFRARKATVDAAVVALAAGCAAPRCVG